MRRLFGLAFGSRANRWLLVLTAVAMCLLTIASQLELFALGVIMKKGPDFFELFSPTLQPSDSITVEELQSRWNELDPSHTGVVTKREATQFLSQHARNNFLDKVMSRLNRIFPVQ